MQAPKTAYEKLQLKLRAAPKRWLVTGAAGFIGSHLVEVLLQLGQEVVGLDNFSTGHRENLAAVRKSAGPKKSQNFKFIKGDIRKLPDCAKACRGVDYVLHQAALGSVPRSIEDPIASHESNVTGFVNMLVAARDAKVKRIVYASSSSVYGDEQTLPKREEKIGRPLSPYAVTKYIDELYAEVFARCYGMEAIGLRYFNVFGPRQDPNGPYAAVIPKWIEAMQNGEPIYIYGDGKTSRDFCYVQNVVQANLLAATTRDAGTFNRVYNVAAHEQTSLNELFSFLRRLLLPHLLRRLPMKPKYRPFRPGDVRHSLADMKRARALLGFKISHDFATGLSETIDLLCANCRAH